MDPNLDHPFSTIPWKIVEIHSNQDDTLRFNFQRHVAGTKIFMTIDNANEGTIVHIKPFSTNEEAICEFNMEIYLCAILGKVDERVPGGGVLIRHEVYYLDIRIRISADHRFRMSFLRGSFGGSLLNRSSKE